MTLTKGLCIMTRCLTTVASLALLFGASSVCAKENASLVDQKVAEMTPPADSKGFAMKAAESGTCEVKLAQLAQKKTQNSQVRELAAMLEKDHSQANTELSDLAKTKNIALSTDIPSDKQATLDAFGRLEGAAFDNAFLLHNIKGHLAGVMMFRREADAGTDPDMKAWAAKTLPTLQRHSGHIATVAQAQQIPVDVLATGNRASIDSAVPAGARIPGTNDGAVKPTPRPDTPDRK